MLILTKILIIGTNYSRHQKSTYFNTCENTYIAYRIAALVSYMYFLNDFIPYIANCIPGIVTSFQVGLDSMDI